MIELFTNLPEWDKKAIRVMVDLALREDLFTAFQTLKNYRELCDEAEQEYMDFYFNLRIEELKNENNTDQREERER